jgi:hypothetical protein
MSIWSQLPRVPGFGVPISTDCASPFDHPPLGQTPSRPSDDYRRREADYISDCFLYPPFGAREALAIYVEQCNNVRLNSAIGYITRKDMLAGRQQRSMPSGPSIGQWRLALYYAPHAYPRE